MVKRRKEQILRVGTRHFARDGFTETDLQDIADALKLGKGTLYRYFPSKERLFQDAVDRVMMQMKDTIERAVAVHTDPLDRLSAAICAYLRFFHQHPAYVELLIQERAAFRDRKQPTYFQYRKANVGRWHEVYAALIKEGRLRDLPVDRISDLIGDLIYGTMFTNYLAGRTKSLVAQADDIVDLIFHGLLTDSERRKRPLVAGEKRT